MKLFVNPDRVWNPDGVVSEGLAVGKHPFLAQPSSPPVGGSVAHPCLCKRP